MHNSEGKTPTNGETDGDDADIYDKALEVNMIERATLARAAADRLRELVHTSADALQILIPRRLDTPETKSCVTRLADELGAASGEALKRMREFRPLVQHVHDLLSALDTAEARTCREALRWYLGDSKRENIE